MDFASRWMRVDRYKLSVHVFFCLSILPSCLCRNALALPKPKKVVVVSAVATVVAMKFSTYLVNQRSSPSSHMCECLSKPNLGHTPQFALSFSRAEAGVFFFILSFKNYRTNYNGVKSMQCIVQKKPLYSFWAIK